MCNADVKTKMRKAGVYQWEVAKKLGICEMTLIRWLREELSPDKRNRIEEALEALRKERES